MKIYGTCSFCSNRHIVTKKGVIAKHGYRVAYGTFNGVCSGSGKKPFELTAVHAADFMTQAQKELDALNLKIQDIESYSDMAYVSYYNGSFRDTYLCEVFLLNYQITAKVVIGSQEYLEPLGNYESVQKACEYHNNRNMLIAMRREREALQKYVERQYKRISNWVLSDLIISAK